MRSDSAGGPGKNTPCELLTHLTRRLEAHPASRYLIGYSGGLDSTVLLHLAARLKGRFSFAALHIHHGLSPEASLWERRCRETCRSLAIPFETVRIMVVPQRGESPEEAARRARYRAFEERLRDGEMLLLAHHAGDLVETVLLNLLRGGGLKGLSGIPETRPLGRGQLLRPLLHVPREVLRAYAEAQRLSWIEDGSNGDLRFDRNFLRHRVIPQIKERWPELERTIARSAKHLDESRRLLDELADEWLEEVAPTPETLSLQLLQRVPLKRQRLILRRWLERQLGRPPSTDQLVRIFGEVIAARPDRIPELRIDRYLLRRYRKTLYLEPTHPSPSPNASLPWPKGEVALKLPGGDELRRLPRVGEGISAARWHAARVEVRFRQGGEVCRLPGRGRRPLKKLLWEWGIPPWRRDRLPLLYLDGHLAAIADLAVCEPFPAGPGEPGYRLLWLETRSP